MSVIRAAGIPMTISFLLRLLPKFEPIRYVDALRDGHLKLLRSPLGFGGERAENDRARYGLGRQILTGRNGWSVRRRQAAAAKDCRQTGTARRSSEFGGLGGGHGGAAALLGWIGAQVTGNLALAFELAYLTRWTGGSRRAASIVLTVAWALSGALQWLRGLSQERKELRRGLLGAGYAWLGLACVKLLLADLAGVDTPLRALAFLAVGGIFLSAALLAHRSRRGMES